MPEKGDDTVTNQAVAVKQLATSGFFSLEDRMNEVNLLIKAQHRYVVRYVGHEIVKDRFGRTSIVLFMELCECDLFGVY